MEDDSALATLHHDPEEAHQGVCQDLECHDSVTIEGGAEHPPGLLEGIVDQEGDHDRDEDEENPEGPAPHRWDHDKGNQPPDLALQDEFQVELEQIDGCLRILTLQEEKGEYEGMDDRDPADQTGEGQPTELRFEGVR